MISIKCPDVQRWIPPVWNQFLANYRAKKLFHNLVTNLRLQIANGQISACNRYSLLFAGPSRTGKTAMVKFFVRCLLCDNMADNGIDPCDGSCQTCRENNERFGLYGVFAIDRQMTRGTKTEVHFAPIDCTLISSPTELKDKIGDIDETTDGITVVYLDEVHRLVSRSMDEILLKAVEEKPFFWILSTAVTDKLDIMLKNRLLKITTELPTQEEMAVWLTRRCEEWGISYDSRAIVRVVQKSNCVVGIALQAIAMATIDPSEGLSLDLVENVWQVHLVN